MAIGNECLEVYEAGPLTVLGFGGRDLLGHMNVADCREKIEGLLDEHACHTLAFDLTGVTLLPSGLLGMLASLKQRNVDMHLYNASADIQEVLQVTKLDGLFHLHEVEV